MATTHLSSRHSSKFFVLIILVFWSYTNKILIWIYCMDCFKFKSIEILFLFLFLAHRSRRSKIQLYCFWC